MTTIDTIVYNYMMRKRDADNSNYDYYLTYALAGAKQLNMRATNNYKSVMLDINPNTMSAQLPPDYVNYCVVALSYCGKLFTLDLARNMDTTPYPTICNIEGQVLPDGERLNNDLQCCEQGSELGYDYGWSFYGVWYGSQWQGDLFAVGAGFPSLGCFQINHEKTRIYFQHLQRCNSPLKVVLTYQSNGLEKGSNVYIDELVEAAVTAYMRYNIDLDMGKSVAASKPEWEEQYNYCKNKNFAITIETLKKDARRRIGTGVINR